MGEPVDLNKAGARLQRSIQILSGCKTINAFFNKYKDELGIREGKTIYNLTKKDKLELKDIQVFVPIIDGFSVEYVIDGDPTKDPEIVYKSLQTNTNKKSECEQELLWKDKEIEIRDREISNLNKLVEQKDMTIKQLQEHISTLQRQLRII